MRHRLAMRGCELAVVGLKEACKSCQAKLANSPPACLIKGARRHAGARSSGKARWGRIRSLPPAKALPTAKLTAFRKARKVESGKSGFAWRVLATRAAAFQITCIGRSIGPVGRCTSSSGAETGSNNQAASRRSQRRWFCRPLASGISRHPCCSTLSDPPMAGWFPVAGQFHCPTLLRGRIGPSRRQSPRTRTEPDSTRSNLFEFSYCPPTLSAGEYTRARAGARRPDGSGTTSPPRTTSADSRALRRVSRRQAARPAAAGTGRRTSLRAART